MLKTKQHTHACKKVDGSQIDNVITGIIIHMYVHIHVSCTFCKSGVTLSHVCHCTHPSLLISSPTGVVSLSPNETGIIPLKASRHSPPPTPSTSSTSASHSTNSSRSLCFSDVPLGTTTVSVLHVYIIMLCCKIKVHLESTLLSVVRMHNMYYCMMQRR